MDARSHEADIAGLRAGRETGLRSKRWGHARVLGLYSLATLLMTWPIAIRAWQSFPHNGGDTPIFLWNNWWFGKSLSEGVTLYHTPYLFYPTGATLVFHSNSQLNSLLANLLTPVTGSLAAYNIVLLLGFVIGGWGMFLLARDVTGSERAAFVAGLVYAFAPYHVSQALAHPNLASVQWYPFMALCLRWAMRRGSIRAGALGGVFFALSLWSGLHLGYLGASWAGLFVLHTVVVDPLARTRRSIASLAVCATTALLLSAPALLPVAREMSSMEGGMRSVQVKGSENRQTDPVAWVTPPRFHPLLGRLGNSISKRFDRNFRWIPYLGFVPLALALYAAWQSRPAAVFWWASGLLWMVLAMGSSLRFNGTNYPNVTLPFALVSDHFPFNTLRSSDRYNLLVPLSLAMLVAFALSRISVRRAYSLAATLILFEYLSIPLPMKKAFTPSPFIARMASDTESYAVVNLPMGQNYSKRWEYQQTFHGKPIVEGHISRVPPHAYDFIESIELLRAFRDDANPPPSNPLADLCRLEQNRVRYIMISTSGRYAAERLERWTSWLPGEPISREDGMIVYSTDGACARTCEEPLADSARTRCLSAQMKDSTDPSETF